MQESLRVTVWNEFRHEKKDEKVKKVYPEGMHAVIAGNLNKAGGIKASLAALDDAEQGLSEKTLNDTDVLIYWAHGAHGEVLRSR
jgi:trehalose utilization protein